MSSSHVSSERLMHKEVTFTAQRRICIGCSQVLVATMCRSSQLVPQPGHIEAAAAQALAHCDDTLACMPP